MNASRELIHPLKKWRDRKALTQEEAASVVNLHRMTYRRLENAERLPDAESLTKIQRMTGIDANTFYQFYNLKNQGGKRVCRARAGP